MNVRWLCLAGLSLVLTGPAYGQTATPPAADGVQEFERTLPYEERVALQGPVVRMSTRDVVDLALQHNLDLAIERYSRDLALRRLLSARAYYDPAVSVGGAVSSARTPGTGASGGRAIPYDEVDVIGFTPGLRQNLPGGGNLALSLTNSRTSTTNPGATINPLVGSALSATLTQPLARGFLATAADRSIDLARLDVDLAASQYRQRVTAVLQQVLSQYWELEYAVGVYEARRQAKDLAIVQYEGIKLRVQTGLLPPVALTSARAEIASRERDILQAEVQVIGAENALKFLISSDAASPIWQTAVLATEEPRPADGTLDLEKAVEIATARRPEIEQLRLQGAQNAVDQKFYRREKLPSVNLTASLTSTGRTGTVLIKQGDIRFQDPTNPSYGGFGRSWGQVFGFNFPAWGVGVNVSVPLRNRAAEAQFDQVTIVRSRLDTQMARAMQAVRVEVKNTVQVIATQRKSLEAARLTTQLFKEQLEAQTARYEANFSSDFELRRYQRDLVDARVRELRALVDLQLAVIALQRATDTLLDEYGVTGAPALTPVRSTAR